jgi:hypothetical protein
MATLNLIKYVVKLSWLFQWNNLEENIDLQEILDLCFLQDYSIERVMAAHDYYSWR